MMLTKEDKLYGEYIQRLKDGDTLIHDLRRDIWYINKRHSLMSTAVEPWIAKRIFSHPAVRRKIGWRKMIYYYQHDYDSPWEG